LIERPDERWELVFSIGLLNVVEPLNFFSLGVDLRFFGSPFLFLRRIKRVVWPPFPDVLIGSSLLKSDPATRIVCPLVPEDVRLAAHPRFLVT